MSGPKAVKRRHQTSTVVNLNINAFNGAQAVMNLH